MAIVVELRDGGRVEVRSVEAGGLAMLGLTPRHQLRKFLRVTYPDGEPGRIPLDQVLRVHRA